MSKEGFLQLVGKIASTLDGQPLDDAMAARLNSDFPADGEDFRALKALCAEGERDGWLMEREHGGIKFGRAVKPGADAGGFSVDVVRMADIKGPHHVHTTGEIGAIMPISGDAKFDGMPEGWYVYGPGSAHHPTVTDGDAYVLYLLPDGAIEFTGK